MLPCKDKIFGDAVRSTVVTKLAALKVVCIDTVKIHPFAKMPVFHVKIETLINLFRTRSTFNVDN